jgi:hypothetical protein
VRYFWEPVPETIARVRRELEARAGDPDGYWRGLIDDIKDQVDAVAYDHQHACELPACQVRARLVYIQTIFMVNEETRPF